MHPITSIGSLPNEVLLQTFEYLDDSNLRIAGQVCKNWETLHNTEYLWKALFNNYLKVDSKPHLDETWKAQFRVLHNWIKGNATKKEFISPDRGQIYRSTLIDDEPYMVQISEPENRKFRYTVLPCNPNKELPSNVIKFDTTTLQGICFHLFETTYATLECEGSVSYFDIITGQSGKLEDPESKGTTNPRAMRGEIHCLRNEIVTCDNLNGIRVWNKISGLVESRVIFPSYLEDDDIWEIQVTNHFIILKVLQRSLVAVACHKKNETTPQYLTEEGSEDLDVSVISASGPYVALTRKNEDILIFKEIEYGDGIKIELIHTISSNIFTEFVGIRRTRLDFFHNWLVISKQGESQVVDIRDMSLLFKHVHNIVGDSLNISLNFNTLLVKYCMEETPLRRRVVYTVFDFKNSPPQ